MFEHLRQQLAFTSERPQSLINDAAARYYFAARYCIGKRVLDAGTGLGFGAKYLKSHGAKYVFGIDYSASAIKIAQASPLPGVDFAVMNTSRLSGLSAAFDRIIFFEVIEHLPITQVDLTLKLLARLLRPGGRLLLSTPNGQLTEYFLNRPYNPFHTKEYTPAEIKKIMSPYFSSVTVFGIGQRSDTNLRTKQIISSRPAYQVSRFLGGFKLVRELLALIPAGLKQAVTGESALINLGPGDYRLTRSPDRQTGLFVVAKK